MARSSAPRVCVLTPEGRGAIAVVRVWGDQAVATADRVFRPARGGPLAETPAGRPRLGRAGEGLGDEVVAVIVSDDRTEVEIQCHGGRAAVDLVVGAFEAAGAERRQPVCWARASAGSRIEAEATVDLVRAPTVRAAETLLEQAQGALEAEVRDILDGVRPAAEALDELLARADLGLRLVCGWRVVLAGRPNVGKSRLLNALSGFERAIVSPTPGTTRDVVSVRIALDGWPFEVSDTAGLRPTIDAIEAEGIALARTRQNLADLLVVVLDRSVPADSDALEQWPGSIPRLMVANKSDLPAAWHVEPSMLSISAERGDGVDALGKAIVARLVPRPPSAGSGVPFRPRHVRILRRARQAIANQEEVGRIRPLLESLLG